MALIIGGIEGGATNSRIVLLNRRGEKLGFAEGPPTNQWLIGLEETARRLFGLIDDALKDAHLPERTPLTYLGMALSGVDREETKQQLIDAMRALRKDFAGSVQICNDSIGAFLTATDDPSIVLIAGTGSISKFVREDLTFERVGGHGYLLGDGGGSYYTVHYMLSKFLEIEEGLRYWEHDIEPVRELIYNYFKIDDSLGLLPHFYETFEKGKVGRLCKGMSRAAREGEPLCRKAFYKSGQMLGRHVRACLARALNGPPFCKCALALSEGLDPICGRCKPMSEETHETSSCGQEVLVICCGKVFRSWDILRDGFRSVFTEDLTNFFRWSGILKLVSLNTTAAYGAARLVARLDAGIKMPVPEGGTTPLEKIYVNST